MKCLICDTENPAWSWTDTHGIAQCLKCGTPYRILHYEGEGEETKRIEKEPSICVKEEYISMCRKFHSEIGRMIPSGHSFGYSDLTQELASRQDAEAFNSFMKKHQESQPKPDSLNTEQQ